MFRLVLSGETAIPAVPSGREERLSPRRLTRVPSSLAREVRGAVAKGEFSRFVARALRAELVRLKRDRFITEAQKHHGPVDAKEVERNRKMLREA
jgi:hypothetical protein